MVDIRAIPCQIDQCKIVFHLRLISLVRFVLKKQEYGRRINASFPQPELSQLTKPTLL